MQKNCQQCGAGFDITDEDLKFYERVSPIFNGKKFQIPPPTLCPNCRQKRRLCWRNERHLYSRTCDLTGENIIAAYAPDTPYKVFEQEAWWSDQFDGKEYEMTVDLERPFFDQLQELIRKVPRMNLAASNNENCDYVNYVNYSKDSYLVFGCHAAEQCFHSWRVHHCLMCFDSTQLNECKYCYECIDCDNCYNLFYCQNCQNCHDSKHLYNCQGCSDCFLCVNLIHKKHCILNEQYSEQEYKKRVEELSKKSTEELREIMKQHGLQYPRKCLDLVNCENCLGDYLVKSKNCQHVYLAKECEDCRYVFCSEQGKDLYDCDMSGWPGELFYESISAGVNCNRACFSSVCWSCNNTYYSDSCFNSDNLFGCVGLKKAEYCILNRQYTKEEYGKLVSNIIEHMQETKEWGEFMPHALSPFGYNETIAHEYFPLGKEEALEKGFNWSDYHPPAPEVEKTIPADQLLGDINEIPDDILNWAIECEITKKPFVITKQELSFYRDHSIPIPKRHPDQRHRDRMSLRNPQKIWERTCQKCSKSIQTTYASERPEVVYCEECYLKELY